MSRIFAVVVSVAVVAVGTPSAQAHTPQDPGTVSVASGFFGNPGLEKTRRDRTTADYDVNYPEDENCDDVGAQQWPSHYSSFIRGANADGSPVTDWRWHMDFNFGALCWSGYHAWDYLDGNQEGAHHLEIEFRNSSGGVVLRAADFGVDDDQNLGPCGVLADAPRPCELIGDPVNTASGAFVTSVTDLNLPGVGVPFELTRNYSSNDPSEGPLGRGWQHSLNPSLRFLDDGDITLRGPDGQQVTYPRTASCSYVHPSGKSSQLSPIEPPLSAYRSIVMADNPTAYWRLNETQGAAASDETGAAGAEYKSVTQGVKGAVLGSGSAAGIGGGARVVAPQRTDLDAISSGLTLEAWVKPDWNATDRWGKLLSKPWTDGPWSDPYASFSLGRDGLNTRIRFDARFENGYSTAVISPELTAGSWYHIAATYDAGAMRLFVNGEQVGTVDGSGPIAQRNSRLVIGTRSDSDVGENWGGSVDEVAVYSQALTAARIRDRTQAACVPTGYELERTDGSRLLFDLQGRLTRHEDRHGQGLSFAYGTGGKLTTVTDSADRVISVTHDDAGRLIKVQLPDGRYVSYGYTSGLLTSVTDVRGNTTTYTYDSEGRLKKIVDQNQHTVVDNTYGADGRVVAQLDGKGHETLFSWDEATQTATMTDARGHQWKDVYLFNVLRKRIDPLGNATVYTYDRKLNLVEIKDARGNTTKMTYDGAGNMLSRVSPAPFSYREDFTYNDRNDLTSYTNRRRKKTTYEYDAAGDLKKIIRPGNVVTEIGRDPATGLVTTVTDPRQKVWRYEYDADYNLNKVVGPEGGTTTRFYDGSGRLESIVEPRGNVTGADPAAYRTVITHDAANHARTVTDPLGHKTEWVYDPAGNLDKVIDAKQRTTDYRYDANNRLDLVTAPDLTTTSYVYDTVGNLVSRTDAEEHTTSYAYDEANRLRTVTRPGERIWTYHYDPAGNLDWMVDAIGNSTPDPADGKTSYHYDELNRLDAIDYPAGTPDVSFTFDANSNRATMTDGVGTETYTYDDLDHLKTVTRGGQSFAYDYDAAGNVTARTYPDGTTVGYGYDDNSRLETVTLGTRTTTYGYDPAGNLETTTLPAANGYIENRVYDRAGRLTELRNKKGEAVLSKAAYVLDPIGNPESVTTTQGTTSYGYDLQDRLTEVCFSPPCATPDIKYHYDDVGNRIKETRPGSTTDYVYNARDELTSSIKGATATTYDHDLNGNMTRAGERSFAFDAANRTKSTTSNGATIRYTYDGNSSRVGATKPGGAATCDYGSEISSDNPSGHWRLGETAGTTARGEVARRLDGTHAGNSTLGQPGATQDGNKSVELQGGHVSLGRPGSLGTNSGWTIEAWINPSQAPDDGGSIITEAYEGDGNVRFVLGYGSGSGNRIFVGFCCDWKKAVDTQDLQLNRWTHFAGTYDGSTLKLYRDGQLVATTSVSAPVPNGNETIYIGKRWDTGAVVRGRVDEVAIYPAALSAARIQSHYQCAISSCEYKPEVMADQPTGYWRLGDSPRPSAKDETGNGDGTYFGASQSTVGAFGSSANPGLSLDGQNSYVSIPDRPGLNPNHITVEAWAKSSSSTWNNYGWVVSKSQQYVLHPWAGEKRISFSMRINGTWRDVFYTPADITVWHHYVGTYDGSTLRFYVDGVEVGSTAASGSISSGPGGPLHIGRDHTPGSFDRYGFGSLDEVAVYNTALSASRVRAHHSATAASYRDEVMADAPVGFWHLGEAAAIPLAAGEVTSPVSGTYAGVHSLGQAGATQDGDRSVDLQGGHVNLGRPGNLGTNNGWTLEAWVNPTRDPHGGAALITEGYEGDGNVRFALGFGEPSPNRMWIGFYGGSWVQAIDPQSLPLNTWTHFVGTYDGTQLKLYRNGTLVAQTAVSSPVPNGNEGIYIGKRWDWNHHTVGGRIDEVAIYPTALLAARIQSHYDCATRTDAETRYTWDVNAPLPQLVAERDETGVMLRRYTHGHDLISMTTGGSDHYFHYGQVGSVTDVTDESGQAQWSYSYEPFGSMASKTKVDPNSPENFMRFTGELYDKDTDLYHLRARQYDAGLGRFTATDPLVPAMVDPYVSSYVYVGGRPTTHVDPSGEIAIAIPAGIALWEVIAGAAAAAGAAATVAEAIDRESRRVDASQSDHLADDIANIAANQGREPQDRIEPWRYPPRCQGSVAQIRLCKMLAGGSALALIASLLPGHVQGSLGSEGKIYDYSEALPMVRPGI